MALRDWACACFAWSPKKILWVSWIFNFFVALVWALLALVIGKDINALYANLQDGDATSNNLVGGILSTAAWGVVLVALFSIFSLVVLLRGVRAATTPSPARGRAAPSLARRADVPFPSPFQIRSPPSPQTIAKTGAGFSYGLIVGSSIHLFFALVEVATSLAAHEKWLQDLGDALWTGKQEQIFAAVVGMGYFSAVCFLFLAIVMISCMKAVMNDRDEPYRSFRDRYGVGQPQGAAGV